MDHFCPPSIQDTLDVLIKLKILRSSSIYIRLTTLFKVSTANVSLKNTVDILSATLFPATRMIG